LVNTDRVVRKLPSLFVSNCSSRSKMGWNAFMRMRYRFGQFKKHNPEKFDTLVNRIIADLSELEKNISLKVERKKGGVKSW
jgi:hypothetical protein